MTFIPLYNFTQILRNGTFYTTHKDFVDVDGVSHSLINPNQSSSGKTNLMPFVATSTATQSTSNCPFPVASSASSIPFNTTVVPNVVGTVSNVAVSQTATGWNMTFSVVGSADAEINSIFFEKMLSYSTATANAVIFALKLDRTVYLNSGNNYTANFAFNISFDDVV